MGRATRPASAEKPEAAPYPSIERRWADAETPPARPVITLRQDVTVSVHSEYSRSPEAMIPAPKAQSRQGRDAAADALSSRDSPKGLEADAEADHPSSRAMLAGFPNWVAALAGKRVQEAPALIQGACGTDSKADSEVPRNDVARSRASAMRLTPISLLHEGALLQVSGRTPVYARVDNTLSSNKTLSSGCEEGLLDVCRSDCDGRGVEEDRAEAEGLLTVPALDVLRKRFPGSPDPVAEWKPPRPCWRAMLPELEVLQFELAVLRRTGGKIVLYGHDDMDGITGVYVGRSMLTKLGFEVVPIIPDRAVEDYGLLPSRMDGILQKGDLLLTVDSGCSAVEGVEWALTRGARVVITDHHTLNPPLPRSHGLIDPQAIGFPGTVLAGCGVLYAALAELFPSVSEDPALFTAVALGTVSDRVPLLAGNRYLLERFRTVERGDLSEGLGVILDAWPNSGCWCACSVRQQITSVVGKGLNSGIGRLLDLMVSDDGAWSRAVWQEMVAVSDSRSQQMSEVLSRAMNEKDPEADAFGMVLVHLAGIPPGMGGTIASKLTRIFRRGSIVVTSRPDGTLIGEARSLGDWDMASLLTGMKDVFRSAGGHAKAAGFNTDIMAWPDLRRRLVSRLSTSRSKPVPEPHVDLELPSLPQAQDLACLAPFGPDFPPPAVKVGGMRYLLQLGPNGPGWCITEDSGE